VSLAWSRQARYDGPSGLLDLLPAAGAMLKAVGREDWVASDDDGYVAIARMFVEGPADLARLRQE
jgi:hypothetical protein